MKIRELLTEAPRVSEETKRVREIIKSWRTRIKEDPQYAEGSFGHFELTPDNELVHKGRAIIVRDFMLDENGELPVKIHSCYQLKIATPKLKSFKNFPDKILYDYRDTKPGFGRFDWSLGFPGGFSSSFNHITSLEGITPHVEGGIDLSMLTKINFSKVNTFINHCTIVAIANDYVGPLLSFLKIDGLKKINGPLIENARSPKEIACAIVTKHLSEDKNILACQEELMDNGLKEYGKL